MTITTIHHDLPLNVSKQVVKSIIGSINATAIAYARGHLRFNAVENNTNAAEHRGYKRPVHADEKCIDDLGDAMKAIDEANTRNTVVADSMGFEIQMQSGELAEHLMRLRNFYAAWLEQHKAQANDNPLSIAETIKFQMSRQPGNDDAMIEALAAAVDIDPELLKSAQIKMITDDTADLKANAGKVLTYLESFESYAKDAAGHMVPVTDDTDVQIESMFDTLPAHVQYKLVSAAIRAHDKAQQKALMALLRGKLDAAGDIKMIKAHRESLITWLVTFSRVKRVQLDAYLERGGQLMEIEDRTVVTSNAKTGVGIGDVTDASRNAAQAPKAPMAPIGSCEVKHDGIIANANAWEAVATAKPEPKAIGKARRAPKPVSTTA